MSIERQLSRFWRRRTPAQKLGILAIAAAVVLGGGHQAAVAVSPSTASGNVALGQQLAASYGWGAGDQWTCLDQLWQQESSWSNIADNSTSGAYGIPQALPATKMPPTALPPENNATAQIRWGLGYIAGRYGTPCGAWSHETADGWY